MPETSLEQRRHNLDLSREGLAAKAGVTARTIYNIEVERVNPQRATKHVIAEALELPVDDLFPTTSGSAPDKSAPAKTGAETPGNVAA